MVNLNVDTANEETYVESVLVGTGEKVVSLGSDEQESP